jgi:tRNA pseudouridine38-40 synthase
VDTRRARFTIAYDGAPFHGFAESPGVPTVVGTLREAMERVARMPLSLVGAGRTDAGVHGWAQVVSVDLPEHLDLDDLSHRLNRMCSPHIVVRASAWVEPDFDARYSATWRQYRYHVWNSPTANPFLAATAWHVRAPLALWAMQLGGDPLIGTHDFASFCRRPVPVPGRRDKSLVRRVMSAHWTAIDSEWGPGLLRFEITAQSFCHQMVRSIVGTLVEVGRGDRRAGEMRSLLVSGDRTDAGVVAPAHGLVLWDVGYGER